MVHVILNHRIWKSWLWRELKKQKLKLLFLHKDTWSASACFTNPEEVLVSHEDQEYVLEGLLEEAKKESKSIFGWIPHKLTIKYIESGSFKIPQKHMETAGQMFIYAFMCPKFMFDWTQLYMDLLQNSSPDIIIQTFNRIIITGEKNGDEIIVEKTKKISKHFWSQLSLPVPSIETITKNKTNVNSIIRKVNHPVHIVDNQGNISPSSFIPFCEFGGNMSAMGVKKDQFKVPVCNRFQAKILQDQLCFEVDLDQLKRPNSNVEKDFKLGLAFFMDYNEDRQVRLKENTDNHFESTGERFDGSNDDESAFIYINTIGRHNYDIINFCLFLLHFQSLLYLLAKENTI